MKLLNFLLAVLVTVSIMAASAKAEVLWSEDFESYEVGTELVGTVDGWHFSSADYSGTSTVVQDGEAKVLKLSKVDGQGADSYDMIFTPLMKIATDNPARELTKLSFRFRPGSGTDLFALYGGEPAGIADTRHIQRKAAFPGARVVYERGVLLRQ